MKKELVVIKVGGNIIDNEVALASFLKDFAAIQQPKLLIHGGGKIATEISKGLGIEAQMVDGRRITDAETLKIVTMVYGGLINKNIVAQLQTHQCNAIGLTGADGGVVKANKRPIKNGIDYGFVGDVKEVKSKVLTTFIESGFSPIVAPLSVSDEGVLLNTNADTMASEIACAMSQEYKVTLVYCFELKGVLRDFEDKDSVIEKINPSLYINLKQEGVISKGMIPKLDNAFQAIQTGVDKVIIAHADNLLSIINEQKSLGTVLSA
jgi:acetylglutamate kinase